MLAKTLLADTFSVMLALGSFAFYFAGFFYPEVHRRTDLVWSGLGLLYAALLWFCAGQMTVVVLLAQLIVVALLLGLGWQTLSVRREKTPVYQQTPIAITPEVVRDWTKNQLNQLRIAPQKSVPVRLEKRASGQQLDPRRRRAYDYEFVEDGLVEMVPAPDPIAEATEALSEVLGEVLSLEALPLEADKADELASEKSASEIIVEVPPSVEAKIISVEVPEAAAPTGAEQVPDAQLTDERDIADVSDGVESAATKSAAATKEPIEDLTAALKDEPVSTDEPALKPAVVDIHLNPETAQTGFDTNVADPSASDSSVADSSDVESPSHEDWGDELFGDGAIESTPFSTADLSAPQPASPPKGNAQINAQINAQNPPIVATREKPSLLATPVILVGWVKDVVTSLTRPKPSKPVIEIPRREPSGAIKAQAGSAPTAHSTTAHQTTAHQTTTAASVSSSADASATTFKDTSPATQPAETEWVQEQSEASYAESASAIAPEQDNWEESNWDD